MVRTRRTSQQNMVPALVRFLLIASVVLGTVFYGVGGWYFADVINDDALQIDPFESEADVLVSAASESTVALDRLEDASVNNDGWYGIRWDSGSGLVGPIMDSFGTSVVREFVPLSGEAPTAGDRVDFDPWVWVDPEQGFGAAFETVTYDAPLGATDAWLIPAESDEWVIAVHGKGADKREALRIASIANRAGFVSLLIDYRNDDGAPEDPSGMYQYGVTEWEDIEAAVEYALDNGADRIVIAGLSTGAALTMSFMYQSDLAAEIDSLIFDSANIDMRQTIQHGAAQRDLPVIGTTVPGSLASSAMWIAERRFDVSFDDWNYLSRVDELQVPILAIHGDSDLTVPHAVSVDLATARPDLVTYEEFPLADHVQSWNTDRSRYSEIVTAFLAGDS